MKYGEPRRCAECNQIADTHSVGMTLHPECAKHFLARRQQRIHGDIPRERSLTTEEMVAELLEIREATQ